jgi:hypothetical protein
MIDGEGLPSLPLLHIGTAIRSNCSAKASGVGVESRIMDDESPATTDVDRFFTPVCVAVVARAWLGQGALRTQAGRRSGVLPALAWINPRFFAFLARRSWRQRAG